MSTITAVTSSPQTIATKAPSSPPPLCTRRTPTTTRTTIPARSPVDSIGQRPWPASTPLGTTPRPTGKAYAPSRRALVIEGRCRNRSTRGESANSTAQTPVPKALASTNKGPASTSGTGPPAVVALTVRPTATCRALAGTSKTNVKAAKAPSAPKIAGVAERATRTRNKKLPRLTAKVTAATAQRRLCCRPASWWSRPIASSR
jgi:hypothetical protein